MPQFEKCLDNFYFYSKEKRIFCTAYSQLSAEHALKTIMIKTATFCDGLSTRRCRMYHILYTSHMSSTPT